MSDLEELHYCIRMEFEREKNAHTITINQGSYIKEVFKHFDMKDFKLVRILFDANSKL